MVVCVVVVTESVMCLGIDVSLLIKGVLCNGVV